MSLVIEKLSRRHRVDDFDCGQESLNRFLTRFALQNQRAEASQTYVVVANDEVLGYYTLVVGHLEYNDAPERLVKGLARHPAPLMILARLSVASKAQGRGLGSALLKDAMVRTAQAAEIAGIRALAVHAKNEAARVFYERFGFLASPADPLHLFLLMKDLRANLSERE